MKRVVPYIAMLLLCASGARSQPSGQITTLRAAASLTNAQASQHQSVDFEATVTYYRSYERNLFVQDGNAAIYVHPPLPVPISFPVIASASVEPCVKASARTSKTPQFHS